MSIQEQRPGRGDSPRRLAIPSRLPQKRVPDCPSLNQLSLDILTVILDELYTDSPESVASVALASAYYYQAARYAQCRLLRLNLAKGLGDVEKTLSRIEDDGLLPAVRRVEVDEASTHAHQADQQLGQRDIRARLMQFLLCLDGLTDIEWTLQLHLPHAGIPPGLVAALSKMPRVRLHVKIHLDAVPDEAQMEQRFVSHVSALQGCTNLVSLDVKLTYRDERHVRRSAQAVRCTLLSCPNVARLAVDIAPPRGGRVPHEAPVHYAGLGFLVGDSMPPLEKLYLRENDIGPKGRPFFYSGDEFVDYPDPTAGAEMSVWADCFDWSRLRRLDIDDVDLAVALAPKLTALEEFSFCGGKRGWFSFQPPEWDLCQELGVFYGLVPVALARIETPSISITGAETIVRHASKLKRLEVHSEKGLDESPPINELDALRRIGEACTLIEDLIIDVERDGAWPNDVFGILATYPSLRRLEIRLALRPKTSSDFATPFLTYDAAKTISSHIQAQRPSGLPPVREIKITAQHRSFPRAGLTPIGSGSDISEDVFLCELAEGAPEVYVVSSQGLNKEENRILAEGQAIPCGDRGDMIRRARDGPLFYLT